MDNKTDVTPNLNPMFKTIGIFALVVCTFVIGFASGRVAGDSLSFGDPKGDKPKLVNFQGDLKGEQENMEFDLFWEVWRTMKGGYVDSGKVDEKDMFYGGIKGVVNSYDDPATIFLTPEETEQFNESSEGKLFEGIGAELGYDNGAIIVISPIKGSPAEAAGILPGDVILKVDGVEVKSTDSIFDVVTKIRGKAGTEVTLTVLHKGDDEIKDIKITRNQISVPSVEVREADDKRIAIIDVGRFTDSSLDAWEKNWDKAVDKAIESKAKAVIIDLRGNPGGFFDAAVYAGGEFLPKGKVVAKQEDREGNVKSYTVSRNGRLVEIPVIVLVNEGSASASEILSGALQKNDRAKVLGEKTYGKGTAQSVINFEDGSSLHVTVLKWLLPDGTWLNRDNPIVPDKEVKYDQEAFKEGRDNQMEEAIKELQKSL